MAASPLYSGVLAKGWSCCSVTMRGDGNKDLFTGPALEVNRRPFTAPAWTPSLCWMSPVSTTQETRQRIQPAVETGRWVYVREKKVRYRTSCSHNANNDLSETSYRMLAKVKGQRLSDDFTRTRSKDRFLFTTIEPHGRATHPEYNYSYFHTFLEKNPPSNKPRNMCSAILFPCILHPYSRGHLL